VLVHFIWQGAAIAFLLILIIRSCRIQRPSMRYGMGLLAMLLMALCPVLTLAWLPDFSSDLASTQNALPRLPLSPAASQDDTLAASSPTRAPSFGATATSGSFDGGATTDSEASLLPLQEPVLRSLMSFSENQTAVSGLPHLQSGNLQASLWRNMQPWIVTGWLLGVALFSLRLLLGWIGLWRLCSQVCPVPAWMLERTRILANALRVTLPGIQLSQRITEAVAVGFFKPLILLPVAWITELPADMLDAVIAHELAHIRRGDLWINLLQRMVETLLFYHPAVWWLSRRLRIERELCCDELVVSVTQNRLRYAETLEHIGRLSLARTQSMLAVSISGSRTVLLDRIRHILGLTPHNRSSNVWFAGLIPLLITGLLIGSAAMFRNGTVQAAGEIPKEEIGATKSGPDDAPESKTNLAETVSQSAVTAAPGVFDGIVRDHNGAPIPRADVVLCRIHTIDGRRVSDVVTSGKADEKGQYALELTPEIRGQWSPTTQAAVWAMAPGFGPGVIQFAQGNHISQPEDDERGEFGLYAERTVNVELTDENGQPLEGEVLGLDLKGFSVPPAFAKQMLTPKFNGKLAILHMTSDPNRGSPATRKLKIQTLSHGPLEFWWNADSASRIAGRIREGVDPVKLKTPPLGRITGQLVAKHGTLPPESMRSVEISIETYTADPAMKTPWCYGFATTKTDAAGRFEIAYVLAGQVGQIRTARPEPFRWRPLVENRGKISVKAGATTNIDIPLIETRTLRGAVRRPTGEAVPNVELSVVHGGLQTEKIADDRSSTTGAYTESTMTDATGRFSIEIIPGDVSVTKQFEPGGGVGSSDLWPGTEKKIPEWQPGNGLRIPAGAEPFELPPIEVSCFKGTLLDESQKPVEAVLVASTGRGGSSLGITQTKANGTFNMEVIGKPKLWRAARRDQQGDFGLPGMDAPDVTIITESPLVLKMIPKPPRVPSDVKAAAQAVKPSSVVNGFQAFEFHAFESSLHNHVFDVGRMETIDLSSRADHETVLHVDRLCRDYGCGDLVWLSSTRQLVGLRGARLLELDIDEFNDIEDVADLSIPDLRKRIEQRGTIAVQLKNNRESDSFVAETREGHLLLLEIEAVDRSSLKVKAQRLTKKEEITFEQPGDGVDQAVWGPITDGLQAGIAYRGGDKSALPSRHFIGELVQVKLFVRNAGTQAQSYSWRRWKANPRIPVQIPVQIPLLDVWQPQIYGAKNLQAITGRQKIHDPGERRTATLQPDEAVLVGATSFSLWPSTEVGFGCYPNRHTSVATSPGRYRLSTELPTQLAGSVPIRTGELDLEVTLPDKEQVNRISQLDGVGHTTNEDFAERWTGWQNARTPRNIRPAAPLAQGEYQAIRCQVYDSKTDQPVAGALAKVSFSARGDQSSDDICEYQTLTDAAGYFEMRIPVELLSGFLKGWQTDFRVHVTHPRYSEMFQSETLEHLQKIGLVAADGKLLTPSTLPKLGVALDEARFAKFQSIGLQPARTLSGRLLGTDGEALPNIHIYGNNSQGWNVLHSQPLTDSEGRFRFNVPASLTMKLEFRTGKFGRTLITAKPEQTDLGDIRAVAGEKVRGQVLDVKGDPVAYVSVTTPAWPDRLSQPNFVYKTDEKGQFESDVLAPGDYEVEVGSISPPSEDNKPSLSGPPPDLYVPLHITVKAGQPVSELTLRPADSVQITSTLLTTVPKPVNDESPQAIDPLYWRVVQEQAKRELEASKPKTPAKPSQAGQPLKLSVDEETGTVVFEGDPQQQQELALNWLQGFSRVPSVTVKGKYRGQDWSRTPNFSELDADPERPKYTCKIPAGLTDVTLEAGDYVQHLQLASGPKLFGRTLHLDQIGAEPLALKIYRYRPTTLKVEFVDSARKPVVLQDNALPAGLVTKARYLREEQVHVSGGRFESSESLMHRAILDNSVLHFVIPGEVIDLSITHTDKTETRQLTLQDGETRTVVVELGKGQTWTEKTAATLPIKGDQK
jgi:beta-lactamase regulating signal transducer with metallopeptidase domain